MKIAQLTCLISVILSFLGCTGESDLPAVPEADLSEAYEEVREFVTAKRDAVMQDRQSPNAWGEYAMALDAHEYGETAEQCYEMAHTLQPDEARWKYLLARRVERTDPDRAVELLLSIGAIEDAETVVLLKLVELLEQSEQRVTQQSVMEQLNERRTENPAVTHRLAQAAFGDGDMHLAELLNQSIEGSYRETSRLQSQIDARLNRDATRDSTLAVSGELPSVMSTVFDSYMAELERFRRDPLWVGQEASQQAAEGSSLAMMRLAALVRKHPQLSENRVLLAMQLISRGQHNNAEQVLNEGLEAEPNDVRLLVALATIRLLQSRWGEAEQSLRQVVEVQPSHPEAWADLAFVLEQQGNLEDAIEAYKTAARLSPGDVELRSRLDQLLTGAK